MKRSYLVGAALMLSLASCDNLAAKDWRIEALQELSAADNSEAIYHLGMAYQTGTGVSRDLKKALKAFRRAAKLGDPLAAYKLGCYYNGQEGDIVAYDPKLALKYKLVAAEAGYALAQQDVASIYARSGENEKALIWLKQAVDQGYAGALSTYASVHNGAQGIPKNPVITAAYFRLFLNRTDGSPKQLQWLHKFEADLSAEEAAQVSSIVEEFSPRPSKLTLKALSGAAAADALIEQSKS